MSSTSHTQSPAVNAPLVASQHVKSVVLLPNLSYPLRPNTYLSQRSGASDESGSLVSKKKKPGCRQEESLVHSADLAVDHGSGRRGVLGALERDRLMSFFVKIMSKAMRNLQIYRAKTRRHCRF